jgi:NADPH:quinone reductase-like Zn-dependent oxidoreductase
MKAIVYHDYGSPDVLRFEDVEKPAPGAEEVRVRVRAASVNPLDWHVMRGEPRLMRVMSGLRKPKDPRLGVDLAGEVEAVGSAVTRFRTGDAVFGSSDGAFAEYACARQNHLAPKPEKLTYEQAATVNVAGLTALQGLRDKGRLAPGQRVLINGAAGGVGTYAVQIARTLGAHVTGVCSTRNLDMVRSIGAENVIDYTREDFTRGGQRYDLIFDCIGNHSLSEFRRLLSPRGIYLIIGAGPGRWIDPLPRAIGALLLSRFVSQSLFMFIARRRTEDLETLGRLIAEGQVKPVIDRRYRLSEVPEAIRYLETMHARGKVVITVDPDVRMEPPLRQEPS